MISAERNGDIRQKQGVASVHDSGDGGNEQNGCIFAAFIEKIQCKGTAKGSCKQEAKDLFHTAFGASDQDAGQEDSAHVKDRNNGNQQKRLMDIHGEHTCHKGGSPQGYTFFNGAQTEAGKSYNPDPFPQEHGKK